MRWRIEGRAQLALDQPDIVIDQIMDVGIQAGVLERAADRLRADGLLAVRVFRASPADQCGVAHATHDTTPPSTGDHDVS